MGVLMNIFIGLALIAGIIVLLLVLTGILKICFDEISDLCK